MTRNTGLIQLEPATTLDDVHKTLSPEPLMTPPEIAAFYRGELNEVRGGDQVGDMALSLMDNQAARLARLHAAPRGQIGKADADRAINDLRTEYTRRLGVGPYDAAELTYQQKAERLVAIYKQEPGYDVPDPVLYSLLNARAVQEFNGKRRFGVHPLVVDILKVQGRLKAGEGRKVPGGTE